MRVQLLIDQKRYAMAQQDLESLLIINPNDFMAHALMAHCLSEQKQIQKALDHAQIAVALAPDTAFCYYILAITQQEANQLKAARESIGQALELNPEDPDFFARLGVINLLEARWQEAVNCAEFALHLDPEHIDSQNLRSMALMRMGQSEQALEQLEHALYKDPENARVHANRGWTLLRSNQIEQAMQAFAEALRLEPDLDWAREGMLEALKSKYWLYRQFLNYSFWMSRWNRKHQFLILIGMMLGMRVVVKLAGQSSYLLSGLLVGAYALFVAMSWLADPLFNLVLFFHPLGRYMLAQHERQGALLTGSLLLMSLIGLFAFLASGQSYLGLLAGLCLSLLLPVAGSFSSDRPPIRRILGIYTLCLTAAGLIGILGLQWGLTGLFSLNLILFVLGQLAFSWFANWLLLKN